MNEFDWERARLALLSPDLDADALAIVVRAGETIARTRRFDRCDTAKLIDRLTGIGEIELAGRIADVQRHTGVAHGPTGGTAASPSDLASFAWPEVRRELRPRFVPAAGGLRVLLYVPKSFSRSPALRDLLHHTTLDVAPFTQSFTTAGAVAAVTTTTSSFDGIEVYDRRIAVADMLDRVASLGQAKRDMIETVALIRPHVLVAIGDLSLTVPAMLAARYCGLPFVLDTRQLPEGEHVPPGSERAALEHRLAIEVARHAARTITDDPLTADAIQSAAIDGARVHVLERLDGESRAVPGQNTGTAAWDAVVVAASGQPARAPSARHRRFLPASTHPPRFVRKAVAAIPTAAVSLEIPASTVEAVDVRLVSVDRGSGRGLLLATATSVGRTESGAYRFELSATSERVLIVYAAELATLAPDALKVTCRALSGGPPTSVPFDIPGLSSVAVLIDRARPGEQLVRLEPGWPTAQRFAVALVPLDGCALSSGFDKLGHSAKLATRYVYQDLGPQPVAFTPPGIGSGQALIEFVPWGSPAQPGGAARAGISSFVFAGAERAPADPHCLDRNRRNVLLVADGTAAVWPAALARAVAQLPHVAMHVLCAPGAPDLNELSDSFDHPNVMRIDPGRYGAASRATLAMVIDGEVGGFDDIITDEAIGRDLSSRSLRSRTMLVADRSLDRPMGMPIGVHTGFAAVAASSPAGVADLVRRLQPLTRSQSTASIVIAAHDFKFIEGTEQAFRASGARVTRDCWQAHKSRFGDAALPDPAAFDAVICEWCLGNAVWWSRHLPPGKRLIVRFHSQELFTDYPAAVDFGRVDAVIFISPHIMREAIAKFAIPADKCHYVPISVDFAVSNAVMARGRSKVVGMVGITPWLKRIDRAISIIEALLERHPDVKLRIRGSLPSDYIWMSKRPAELSDYGRAFAALSRLADDGAVELSAFDPDMASFYGGIGWLLSVSDREGCHAAVAEAGCAGAIPLILDWPGSRGLYPSDCIFGSEADLVAAFSHKLAHFDAHSAAIRAAFSQHHAVSSVHPAWVRLVGI